MPRKIVWKGFLGALWAWVRYGMATYALSEKESSQVFSKLFRPLFPLMGIHRNFPMAAATLPPIFLGLGIPDTFIECGIERISIFITNMGLRTLIAQFIEVSLQALQIEVGLVGNILEQDFQKWGYLATPSWIASLWDFVSRYNIKLKTSELWLPSTIRERDRELMEELYNLGYRRNELIRINIV